ncbi:MAG: glycosyltransferase [Armatimonadota bacterium]
MKKSRPAIPASCSVIIAAYNNFATLQKVLWGYEAQTHAEFDVLIADDGSNAAFTDRLNAFTKTSPLQITHLWQPDEGYRKGAILNHAISSAFSEYLIFTDAEFVPRNDFVASHLRLARRGRYLTGGTIRQCEIPPALHETLTEGDIKGQLLFDIGWLRRHAVTSPWLASRVAFRGLPARVCDLFTVQLETMVGCNASAFRDDLLQVQGFDETFGYGGLDRDLGIRLNNIGVHGAQHQYSLCGVHLEHPRPYRSERTVAAQRKVMAQRRRKHTAYPRKGIERAPEEVGSTGYAD